MISGINKTYADIPSVNEKTKIRDPFVLGIKERLHQATARIMQEIAHEHETNRHKLGNGLYYAADYAKQLKEHDPALFEKYKQENIFYYNRYPDEHFSRGIMSSGIMRRTAIIKKETTATQALKALRSTITLTGCKEACQIAELEAVLNILGEKKFDALFGHESPTPLTIGRVFYFFSKCLKVDSQNKVWEVGTQYNFSNVTLYDAKHLEGYASGFNVICIGFKKVAGGRTKEPLFTGLGLPAKGVTRAQLNDILLDEYNKPPVELDFYSPDIAKKIASQNSHQAKSKQIATLDAHGFKKFKGGSIDQYAISFDAEKIALLAKASTIEEVKALQRKWTTTSEGKHAVYFVGGLAVVALASLIFNQWKV